MVDVGWSDVHARRLARGGLTAPSVNAVEAARTVGGVHAQVLSAAELSLAARVRARRSGTCATSSGSGAGS